MNWGILKLKACRRCRSQHLQTVWDLGQQYLADCLAPGETGRQAPLEVVRCGDCGLAQLAHALDRSALYSRYYYRSSISETMRKALEDVRDTALAFSPVGSPGRVLDIGCNDGYLLSLFPTSWTRCGIDPSDIPVEHLPNEGRPNIVRGYFPEAAKAWRAWKRASFDVITSVAMIYDVPNPLDFCKTVNRLLRPGGIWVNQLNTLAECMKRNAFDFISHEHLTYWTICDLISIAQEAGLQVLDAQELELNGGTTRLVFKKSPTRVTPDQHTVELQVQEIQEGYTGPETGLAAWAALKNRVDANGQRLRTLVNSMGRVFVRGASTRGNGLLQYYGLSVQNLPLAADRDPRKWGKVMAGTNIPIMSEDQAKAQEPDAFLILPYSYLDQFLMRDKEWLLMGGKYIVPLPEARVMP
jgi:SAM-dependent methyltransferase